jgi:hypothetical protein
VQTVAVEGFGPIQIELDGDAVDVRMGDGERLRFDLAAAVEQFEKRRSSETKPVALKASSGAVSGTLLVDRIVGAYDEPDFSLNSVRLWLILE